MSLQHQRKPLLRFETSEKAQLISSSMPSGVKKRRSGKRSASTSSASKKPKVIKGRVNIRVPGYLGVQKIAPSSLIPHLPASKIRQAAKKALGASGKKKTTRRRKRTGKKQRRK
jgi:hypothetical protein